MNTRSFHSRHGFTLVELMLATSLSTILVCAIMSVFVLFARSSRRIDIDSAMERATSLGLEQFARDLRMAQSIVSTGTPISRVDVSLPNATGTGTSTVSYIYSAEARTFIRTSGGISTVVVREIQPGSFDLKRFDLAQNASLTDYDTNQIQLTMTLGGSQFPGVTSTSKRIVSSRFVLRNR
jgi:prepilin-type N-terminal cleavage/methylation domain-containing protein